MKISIKAIRFILFLSVLVQMSCKTNKSFIGYNDLVNDSPKLLWSSSIEDLIDKYPNAVETMDKGIIKEFDEYKLDGKVKYRNFQFINNKLFMVLASYGNYSFEMLELLREDIEKKYGKITIENNGTIESWYIENNKNNQIVLLINKLENNVVNCSYIFPPLRDESLKTPISRY
jgi:hypothetical protein